MIAKKSQSNLDYDRKEVRKENVLQYRKNQKITSHIIAQKPQGKLVPWKRRNHKVTLPMIAKK